MQKLKLLAFTMVMAGTLALSQKATAQDAKFRIGVKGGLNLTNLYTDDETVDKENMLVGFHGGAFFKIPINERVGLQPEVLFSTKGAKYEYKSFFGGNEGELKFRLNYVDVPVMLMVNLTDNLNIQAGPYFGILLSSKLTNEIEDGDAITEEIDKDDFNTTDYGISAGLGFDFDKLSFGARYNYGLSKVGKERDFLGTSYTFPDAKNSNFQLYISISIL